ncbi:hypothetical protein [Acidovorax sp.]|uniref:hypothetical protein n=1 Tax=Acidovorax sp. TaxID=1872122 RepID=UPI004037C02D
MSLHDRKPWAVWVWPLLGCVIGWLRIYPQMKGGLHPDAEYVYLPAARALLDQGWSFFASAASYRVAPLGYVWPALWGADPAWIRGANCVLWAGCMLAAWRCATLLGGLCAGVVAIALLALHPELIKYFPTELTEPIFLFGLFGWLWTLTEWLIGQNESRTLRASSAAFLTLTLLSRPVLQLLVPLGLLATLLLAWRWRRSAQPRWQAAARLCGHMAGILAISLALPAALTVKNGLLFGLWGLGTGAGTGIYLGVHPLFQGTEPAFLGLAYDINDLVLKVTGNRDHLTLAADRVASSAAWLQISSLSLGEGFAFFSRKLWWWMAHHPESLAVHGNALRTIRLFEWLALAACTIHMAWVWRHEGWTTFQHRLPTPHFASTTTASPPGPAGRQLVMWLFLAGVGGLVLAQLLPILYNSRYSSALLDPWLLLLTGFSTAYFLQPYRFVGGQRPSRWHVALVGRNAATCERVSLWPGVITLPALFVIAALCFNTVRRYEVVTIDNDHIGAHRARLVLSDHAGLSASGMALQPDGQWRMTESPAVLALSLSAEEVASLRQQLRYNALWEVHMTVQSQRINRCRIAHVTYTRPELGTVRPVSRVNLRADGQPRLYALHANADLRPDAAGDLRLTFHCPVGTLVRWHGARLLESFYTEHTYQQLTGL